MKVLVMGATGLLGSNLMAVLDERNISFVGSIRESSNTKGFRESIFKELALINNIFDYQVLKEYIDFHEPNIIVNCLSMPAKNFKSASFKSFIDIYSSVPVMLRSICSIKKIKYIHISSDGVFSGKNGPYTETDVPDPQDYYGHAKLFGEVGAEFGIAIRTSIIGHSLTNHSGLLDWFLSQKDSCVGFSDYIFSGLTARELSKIIIDYLLKESPLKGVINIGGPIISKYDLLDKISKVYNKKIKIEKKQGDRVNRALDSSKFIEMSGYKQTSWELMLADTKKNQF